MIMENFLEVIYNIGSLLFVFIAIGFCIFSHELGHFLAAKWCGLHIDAFALGFKPFWRKKYNGVEYRLGWLPFGGYCEIPQVDATDEHPKAADGTILPRAQAKHRVITAVAGPLFNIISGLLIACIVWIWGMPQDSPKMREITVLTIEKSSPEYNAGLRANDVIVKLNGKRFFDTWGNFVSKILFTVGEVELEVKRGNETKVIRYVPKVNPKAPSKLAKEGIAWPFFTPLIPLELTPEKDSPAAKAGIKKKDILVAINKVPVSDYFDFQQTVDMIGGKPATFTIRRDGKVIDFTVIPQRIKNLGEEYNRYLIGIQFESQITPNGIKVSDLINGGNAAIAGVKVGDCLTHINNKKISDVPNFLKTIRELKTTPFVLSVLRDNKKVDIKLASKLIEPHTIGVSIAVVDHPTPIAQFISTLTMSWKSLRGIVVGVGNKLGLTEKQSSLKPSHMSGPLGMGMVLFNSVRKSSLIAGIYFTVVISFALAIFNLLPFPVLDGGHILFGFIEMIIKRPLPTAIIKGLSTTFVVLLIGLMIYVTFSDGRRLYRGFFPDKDNGGKNVPAKTQP